MTTGLTRVATYTNELEAMIDKGRLEALGIAVVVNHDNCGGMRPHLDLHQGVRLLVADEDAEKARGALAAVGPEQILPAWSCPGCGEAIDAGFDTCWQCGHQLQP